jgi:hypothetical protein
MALIRSLISQSRRIRAKRNLMYNKSQLKTTKLKAKSLKGKDPRNRSRNPNRQCRRRTLQNHNCLIAELARVD